VAAAFGPVFPGWWVAGGYAIELAVGYPVRAHHDIDVLLLRRDQMIVQQALAGWEWWAADRIRSVSPDRVPYLVPKLRLFYKAQEPRPKDEQDFAAALPMLDRSQRDWLASAVALAYGPHPWHARLT
jgi:hypothetical protein